MKKNFVHVAVIFAVLAGSTAVYAQMGADQGGQWSRGQGQPMTADQRLQRMTKQLNLSDAQQQQIKPILNADQQQKYEQMMSHQGHGHGGPGQYQPQGQAPPPQQ